MEKIVEANKILSQYNDGTFTDEQQVITSLNELNQAQVNKSILQQTSAGKTLSQLIKGNKSSKVVELATALQKKMGRSAKRTENQHWWSTETKTGRCYS